MWQYSKLPFQVRIPASTSNLGCGFDVFSVALKLYLEVEVSRAKSGKPEWVGDWPDSGGNVFSEAFNAACTELRLRMPPLRFLASSEIPLQRGLGSSAAAITGGLMAAYFLAGSRLDTQSFLKLALPLEGHPDNLAAAWKGGWVLCWAESLQHYIESLWLEFSPYFVVAIPEVRVSTARAREVLPKRYSRQDVVHNLQRSSLLLHALYQQKPQLLARALEDRIHQPYRLPLVPGSQAIFTKEALPPFVASNYLGTYLSGSGSTICSLSDDREAAEVIGAWMVEQFREADVEANYKVLRICPEGGRVGKSGE